MRKRWLHLVALGLVVALAAMGCGKKAEPGGEATAGLAQSLTIGTTDKIISMDPVWAYDYFSSVVLFNCAETLVTYAPGASQVSGQLASSWTVGSDGKSYTFKLRSGAKFDDGTAADANAVKAALERVRRLNVEEGAGFLLFGEGQGIDKVEVVDPTTVTITLLAPDVTFVSKLAYTVGAIGNPKLYTDKQMTTECHGSGPYKIVSFKENDSLEFGVNTFYAGPDKPKTPKVLIKFFDKSSAMKLALENGEIDIAFRSFTPTEIENLKENTKVKLVVGKGAQTRYIVLLSSKPPFNDLKNRQAVAAAVDRKAITDTVFKGTAAPLNSMVAQGFDVYKDYFTSQYGAPNAAKAKDLLGGKKLTFDLWWTPTHYGDTEDEVAQVAKRSLEATGAFQVNLQSTEWPQYKTQWKNQQMQAFLLGWYPDYQDPDDYLAPFYSTLGAKSMGAFYSNASMDKMLGDELQQQDVAKRNALFDDIQKLAAQEAPYIPLWQNNITSIAASQPGVSGLLDTLDIAQIFRIWMLSKKK
ncbi:MAG: ABC transporter substrate-binding protein [Actinomycetota bacterium]